ncbi:hypothetical protein JCM8547_004447 [Rhodosporidiobolus lusitaniae]
MSTRTHSILNPNGVQANGSTSKTREGGRKLRTRREEHTGSVLPPPSQWSKGPIVYGHANTGFSSVGQTGYQSGYQAAHSYGSGALGGSGAGHTAYGSVASTYTAGGLTGTNSLRGGSYGGGAAQQGGRLQQKIEEAKEKRRERHQAKRRPDEISKKNLKVDEQGVAHDSEYVQFRTATPLHVQQRQQAIAENPLDDSSASSSSASSSSSGFHSSPYTYQSTHRTTSSSHHPSTISAIPPYLAGHHRTSIDGGPSSLSVPRAPSPHQSPSSSSSLYGDSTAAYGGGGYDRMGPGYGSRTTTAKLRSASTPIHGATTASYQPPDHRGGTTASYQPPAPGFSPRGVPSSDGNSLADSTAQLSLGSTINAGSGSGAGATSGYTKAIKAGHATSSMRPPKMDGSALDAGMHGMKRSFDGFKLDMKFGAHKVGKKLTRTLNNL